MFTLTPEFVLAGKATMTVSNGRGDHYTYRVEKVENKNRPTMWFANLLTGPDNEDDYTYLGVVDPNTLAVRPTRATRLGPETTPFKVLAWALRRIQFQDGMPEGATIDPAGRCGRCGRPLTHPDGVNATGYRLGFGPVCFEKMGLD